MKKYQGKFHNGKYCLFGSNTTKRCYDVRLWVPLFILVLSVVVLSRPKEKIIDISEPEVPVQTVELEVQAEPEPTTIEIPEDSSVVMLARLADSVARGRSDEVKKIVMWVAINRVEDKSHGYGGSLKEEILRPKQWQQFDSSATYLESTLLLADEVYKTWQYGGPRPIYNDMLWFVLNGDGSITVRNQFKDGKNRVEATFGQ